MGTRDNAAPVIIKRKKVVGGGGHHGGAWKVAYADFVTAMMAFFLLMWLLNATTEKQRKGIADFFNPTIPINRVSGGGDGALGGESVFSKDQIAHTGTGGTPMPLSEDGAGQDSTADAARDAETEALQQVQRDIEKMFTGVGGESMVSTLLARHIVTKLNDEGLIVEFFDLPEAPLFQGDTAEPNEVTQQIAAMVARVFGLVPNAVAIGGHTRSYPDMLRENPVWNLSTARAQKLRELLKEAGFPDGRVQRVTGFADRKQATENPMSQRNNRIEVILLRSRL
ncbi:flagellar motor protein MotB [Phaeovulum sp. NW3]|uniref:flagellar motor protein MotB n=1 Tax=Phaeovulum sp. NW3 TaxID=2934933 RepID=UPI00201FDB5E|nr:flagellar motor protein MotB [Phaeovulum sp. NW3]MCL7466456.1 OmpA family protein [Phaeovulum sp. NW3]